MSRTITLRLTDELAAWLAETSRRTGVPVGRIASVVNHAHLAKYNDATGHFGLLQGIDDRQLFTALLDRAAEDLRAKGMRRMQGPFSLMINHGTGILVEGFDEPAAASPRAASIARYAARNGILCSLRRAA